MEFRVYKDRQRKWRWRLVASNGRILADSGQSYTRKGSCLDTIALIRIDVLTADLLIL